MKRRELTVVALSLAVLLANAGGLFAQEKGSPPYSSAPSAVGAAVDATGHKAGKHADPRTEELIAILNETQSVDTLCVTVKVLESMGRTARPAVPAIIRNAERLGLFKGLTRSNGQSRKAKLGDEIVEAILKINEGEQKSPACCHVAPCCVPLSAPPPCLPVGLPTN
jgi:hypothetical protein